MRVKSTNGNRKLQIVTTLLAAGLLAGLMTSAPAGASDADATIAKKKKCKPGFKKVKVKGKKKCRRVPPVATPAPAPAPVTPSTLRATLTWGNLESTPTDVDLIVWDQSGNSSGGPTGTGTGIPATDSSTDNQAFGPETFVDHLLPSTRQFSYGICMVTDNGSDTTRATITYTLANGSAQTMTTAAGALASDGDFVPVATPGGFPPTAAAC